MIARFYRSEYGCVQSLRGVRCKNNVFRLSEPKNEAVSLLASYTASAAASASGWAPLPGFPPNFLIQSVIPRMTSGGFGKVVAALSKYIISDLSIRFYYIGIIYICLVEKRFCARNESKTYLGAEAAAFVRVFGSSYDFCSDPVAFQMTPSLYGGRLRTRNYNPCFHTGIPLLLICGNFYSRITLYAAFSDMTQWSFYCF